MIDISGIDHLGFERVLKRGSGEIIEDHEDAIFLRDRISGAYFLACEDTAAGISLLDRYAFRGCDLLMVSNEALGKAAFERYGYSEKIECFQAAFYGEKPPEDIRITYKAAEEKDLPLLKENYHLISPEELQKVIERKSLLLGYYQDRLIGFIGEHLEGSMGMLYIFPEFRHRGFGAVLQRHLIAQTMKKGEVPFCQVEKDNHISMRLQEKIGMTLSDHLIIWMWKQN